VKPNIIETRVGTLDLYDLDGMTVTTLNTLLSVKLQDALQNTGADEGELALKYESGFGEDSGEIVLLFRRLETPAEMEARRVKAAKASAKAKEKRRKEKLSKEAEERTLYAQLAVKYGPGRAT
jgi:hypothetical protein